MRIDDSEKLQISNLAVKAKDLHRSMIFPKEFLGNMSNFVSKSSLKNVLNNLSHSSHLFIFIHGASKPAKSSAFDRRRRRLMRRRIS